MARYSVRIEKDDLVFSAGHFITFDGAHCERLHGHNYRVSAEVLGPLDENQYVLDFILLRRKLRDIVDELDHRMLLPTGNRYVTVERRGAEVEARFGDLRWVFPEGDCLLLPVENTTSESLARYVAERLIAALELGGETRLERLRVQIDECFGNIAVCELDFSTGR